MVQVAEAAVWTRPMWGGDERPPRVGQVRERLARPGVTVGRGAWQLLSLLHLQHHSCPHASPLCLCPSALRRGDPHCLGRSDLKASVAHNLRTYRVKKAQLKSR